MSPPISAARCYGNANVGYSRSDGFKQLYYGVSGGVLAHANGI
ncbi:fimbria/pilus outer membrane usher protein, partial [Klebsiella pneumoniae]|nr:fimbria/pilus outer membrane usher protein [Klebsiella pneumoniae]